LINAYSATKFAQVGRAECLRAEIRGSAIHVSVVYPIFTNTKFFDVICDQVVKKWGRTPVAP
jgi:short-subunit dehydrogenase